MNSTPRLVIFAAFVGLAAPLRAQGATSILSAPTPSSVGMGIADSPSISHDGRYVAFLSSATNMPVPNGFLQDAFVRDRLTGALECVSLRWDGTTHNVDTGTPRISGNGRYVVFVSGGDLVPNMQGSSSFHVFLRDRELATTELVSYRIGGGPANGNAFIAGTRGPDISFDGRYVAFVELASNLVPNDTNGRADAFVRDRGTGAIERVSIALGGAQPNGDCSDISISADGRWVVFTSAATNMVASDANGAPDVFVHDRQLGMTRLVSATPAGTSGSLESKQGVVSADGAYVAFTSSATDLVPGFSSGESHVYRTRTSGGPIQPISVSWQGGGADAESRFPALSADGSVVAFESRASDLVLHDYDAYASDAYCYDFADGTMRCASVSSSGASSNESLHYVYVGVALSADGRTVVFASPDRVLALGDMATRSDVFAHERGVLDSPVECAGDGTGTSCPCSNDGIPSRGCGNSVAANGATLYAHGFPTLSLDRLALSVGAVPLASPVQFVQSVSYAPGATAIVFGDGVQCMRGRMVRLATLAAGGGGVIEPGSGVQLGQYVVRISQLGLITAPTTVRYAAVYRDYAPYCTSSNLNATNTVRIDWRP